MNWSSLAATYSANAPAPHPNTSSPGRSRCTSLPTASTVPATSVPGTGFFGFRRPVAIRMTNGEPVMRIQSPTWTDAAWTRTSTSSSPIWGFSMSRESRTSAEPYLSWTIAFIDNPSASSMLDDVRQCVYDVYITEYDVRCQEEV